MDFFYGDKPMDIRPPTRSAHLPYASIVGNHEKTASDMWWEFAGLGSRYIYTKMCEHLVGPLAKSRIPFFTQKDAAKADGVKVRYIFDPMIGIGERIGQQHSIGAVFPNIPM